jgi:hypothetical protein
MMRRLLVILAAASLLFGTATAFAQQKINYRVSTYIKIAPDKDVAAMEFIRSSGMKLIQELVRSGRIASYALLRIAYSGIPAADYNYVQVIDFDGAPPEAMNPVARDRLYRKATGLSYAEYQQKLAGFRSVMGTVLSRVEARAPGSQLAEGNYVRTARWKITPMRAGDYRHYLQKMLLPLNSQAVKEGRFVGWNASRTAYPSGGGVAYDATTSHVFKDLASALPTTPASPEQEQTSFAKVFPGESYKTFEDENWALRRTVRVDLWRVEAVAGQGTTANASNRQ